MAPTKITSDVWYHFTKDNDGTKVTCQYCQKKFAYGQSTFTSNLVRHLQRKHPTVIIKQTKSNSLFNEERGDVSSRLLAESSYQALDFNPFHSQMSRESSVDVFGPNYTEKCRMIDVEILKMICKDFHPFSLVEDEEFKTLIKMLNPFYQLPSKKTLSSSFLESIYNETKQKVMMQLKDAKFVSLTCDEWVNANDICIYSLTAHYINDETVLQSRFLEYTEFDNSHTSDDLYRWLENVLKTFKIDDKISAIITKNKGNMKAAILALKHPQLDCFAHSLNCLIQEAINDSIKKLIDKIRCIVELFKKDHAAMRLAKMQKLLDRSELKLKLDDPMYWNSTFDMLERLYFNKDPIEPVLMTLDSNCEFTISEWDNIDHCIKMLSLFNEVTIEILSEKFGTLSKTSIMLRKMEEHVIKYLRTNSLSQELLQLGEKLLQGLKKHFHSLEKTEIVLESIFLDPRFKSLGFTYPLNYEKTRKAIETKLNSLTDSTRKSSRGNSECSVTSSSLWSKYDEQEKQLDINEIDEYLNQVLLSRNEDPLVWWEFRKSEYPKLYSLALERLCIPATSVPCHSIFTKAGQLLNKKRSQFISDKLGQILFVGHNS